MITINKVSIDQLKDIAHEAGLALPIEQTAVWAQFEQTIEGRTPWGGVHIDDDGKVLGVAAFIDYQTHGYHYLRSCHGPVWTREISRDEERAALEALRDGIAALDHKQAFMRLAVKHDLDITEPTLSTLPYDTTVVIDTTGGEDEILSRMKPRGRRDVRKSLRECPAECADETAQAAASFDEYYAIMQETGERDGFTPAPCSDYQSMVATLGSEHCRVFAARIDGALEAWSLVTMNDGRATRYYAATTRTAGRKRVADKLVLFESCQAAELGCREYDLMGIGSDFAPETKNLNEFKTKFAKDGVRTVAPDRDVPIKRSFYAALVKARALRSRLRAGANR